MLAQRPGNPPLPLFVFTIMRLLNTSSLKLYEFYDADIPDYAILSHTWTTQEVSLQMLEEPSSKRLAGYIKIVSFCELALSEGWKYAWVDTCCIDKTSSADLSEAINSMYEWYEKAQICYVYLVDVYTTGIDDAFYKSRWFSRGWTLQELLAPRIVVFCNKSWVQLGTMWNLIDEITHATGIEQDHIMDHRRVSIATKMSWAARRETTRIEDIAYSLLGLFGVNMPLLYGEGSKAFMRLQHELLQTHEDDESIFAWKDAKSYHCGLLARSPAAFAQSGKIMSVKNPNPEVKVPSMTRRLLTMDGLDSLSEYQLQDSIHYAKSPTPHIILNCLQQKLHSNAVSNVVGIALTERDLDYFGTSSSGDIERCSSYLDYFVRSSPGQLLQCKSFRGSAKPDDPNLFHRRMKISLDYLPFLHSHPHRRFLAMLPSLIDAGFVASEQYPEDSVFSKIQFEFLPKTVSEGWKVTFELSRLSMAALLFRSENGEAFAVILTAMSTGLNVDVVVPEGTESLKDIINKASYYSQRASIADRPLNRLQVERDIYATSRMISINQETIYFVDLKIITASDSTTKTPTPRLSKL